MSKTPLNFGDVFNELEKLTDSKSIYYYQKFHNMTRDLLKRSIDILELESNSAENTINTHPLFRAYAKYRLGKTKTDIEISPELKKKFDELVRIASGNVEKIQALKDIGKGLLND